MSHLPFVKRELRKVLAVGIITLASLLLTTPIHAESLTPTTTEITQSISEISNQSIVITNDKNYDIYITPKTYKYYPQNEFIEDLEDYEEFVKIDTDSILISANSSKTLNFQILGLKSLEPGTYYNLIVFTQQLDNIKIEDTNIGTTGNNSHLVILNLTPGSDTTQITEEYDVEVSIEEKGIPFFKPAKVKLTFFNNSQYTLIPKGELQVLKHSKDKPPTYIKINTDRQRVYPKESLEMEFNIDKWYLEDILFGKTVYVKLQNGLDKSVIYEEIQLTNFKNELVYILITMVVLMILVRSLSEDTRKDSKPS